MHLKGSDVQTHQLVGRVAELCRGSAVGVPHDEVTRDDENGLLHGLERGSEDAPALLLMAFLLAQLKRLERECEGISQPTECLANMARKAVVAHEQLAARATAG